MHQYIILDENGLIDTKRTIAKAISAIIGVDEIVSGFDIIHLDGKASFGLIFREGVMDAARTFIEAHPALGQLYVPTAAAAASAAASVPIILLNKTDNIIYLFMTLLKSNELLTDAAVPPFARVDFLELFAAQVIEPLIFYGQRKDEMKVGLTPIEFEDGKIRITLRGIIPGSDNAIFQHDRLDELALICFDSTDAHAATTLKLIKILLISIRKNYLERRSEHGALLFEINCQPVRISSLKVTEGKRLMIISSLVDSSYPPDRSQLKRFQSFLKTVLGDEIKVVLSMYSSSTCIEIQSLTGSFFKEREIEHICRKLLDIQTVVLHPATKEKIIEEVGSLGAKLLPAPGEVRHVFDGSDATHDFFSIFNDQISQCTFANPIVIGRDGHSYSMETYRRFMTDSKPSNPLTREPLGDIAFRENRLLKVIMLHYTEHHSYEMPEALKAMKEPVILPNGETYDEEQVYGFFFAQHALATLSERYMQRKDLIARYGSLKFSVGGCELTLNDIWPNRAIQNLIDFYNTTIETNPDSTVIEGEGAVEKPLISLAATVASLVVNDDALSRDEARDLVCTDPSKLPVNAIYTREPSALRLDFKSSKLSDSIFSLLIRNNIVAQYDNKGGPFSSRRCITIDERDLHKFIVTVCKYSAESDLGRALLGLPGGAAEYTAAIPAATTVRTAAPMDSSILMFLRAMFYGNETELGEAIKNLPPSLRESHSRYSWLSPTRTEVVDAPIAASVAPAVSAVASAITPTGLFNAFLGSAAGSVSLAGGGGLSPMGAHWAPQASWSPQGAGLGAPPAFPWPPLPMGGSLGSPPSLAPHPAPLALPGALGTFLGALWPGVAPQSTYPAPLMVQQPQPGTGVASQQAGSLLPSLPPSSPNDGSTMDMSP